MLIALTGTPRTSNRAGGELPTRSDRVSIKFLPIPIAGGGADLFLDPPVSPRQPLFERNLRLPSKHGAKAGVVGIAATDALRAVDVAEPDVDPGASRDNPGELVD